MGKFLVEVRQLQNIAGDWRYKRIGQIDTYLSLDVIIRYNDVGSWVLTMPADSPQASLLGPGTGVVISYEGLYAPILSGPVRVVKSGWDGSNPWPGTIEFSGPDDNIIMQEHICMPNPTQALVSGQYATYLQSKAYDTYVDNSDPKNPKSAPFSMERLIQRLAYDNFGDGSISGRKVNGCSFAPPASWPAVTAFPKTTYNLRFETVLDAVKSRAEVAVMADGTTKPMGFRWVWDTDLEKLVMKVYYPNNTPALGKGVRFSRENGNLASYSYTLEAPKSNWMLVGLDQEVTDKPETQHLYIADKRADVDVVDWQMSAESYKDETSVSLYLRDVDGKLIMDATLKPQLDTKTINTTIDTAWQSEAPIGGLIVTPLDTKGCRFGVHYWLGDLVTVVEGEAETTSILREVHLTDGSSGVSIQSTIGDSTATETPALYKELRKVWAAIRKAQKTKTGVIYG
jgi:hypothetical protein